MWYKIKSRTYTQGEGRWELFQKKQTLTLLDSSGTAAVESGTPPSTKAHPAKAGAAKPRVLASSATPHGIPPDATKDPTTAELPKGRLTTPS